MPAGALTDNTPLFSWALMVLFLLGLRIIFISLMIGLVDYRSFFSSIILNQITLDIK